MQRVLAPDLIGRSTELATMVDAVVATVGGPGVSLAVPGEAGSGKSRLVAEVSAAAADRGVAVLAGRCVEGSGEPYRPVVEALMAADLTAAFDDVGVRPFRALLSRVVPLTSAEGVTDVRGVVLAEAVLRLLAAHGGRGGALLVIEDLHWAEPDSMALVRDLVTHVARHHVAVVVTTRPGSRDAEAVVEAVGRSGGLVTPLAPLDGTAVDEMVRSCLGDGVPLEVGAFVRQRAEGLPLYVEELLAGLLADGALVREEGRWRAVSRLTPRVPASFAASVDRRLRELDPVVREAVEAAGVLGADLDWGLVAGMCALGSRDLEVALRGGLAAQLFTRDERGVRFRHALTRDAVLASMLPPRRAELASRALALLDPQDDGRVIGSRDLAIGLAELSGRHDRAARLLLEAGQSARDQGALATARQIVQRADTLRLGPDLRLAVDELGTEVLALAGETALAEERGERALGELARRPGTEGRRVALLLALARAEFAAGRWSQARRHADAARALPLVGSDQGLLARISAVDAHVAVNEKRYGDAVAAAEAARSVAEDAQLPEVVCEALEVLGRVKRFTAPAEAAGHFEQAATVATAHGLGGWRVRAVTELAIDTSFIEGRLEPLEEARALAASAGALMTVAVIDLHLAGAMLVNGIRDPGGRIAQRCVDDCRRYGFSMLPIALLHVAAGRALAGDRPGAEVAAEEAVALAPDDPDITAGAWGWVRGDLAYVLGDHDRWLECLDRAMDVLRGREGTIPFPFRSVWPVLCAAAGRGLDAVEEVAASHMMAIPTTVAFLELARAVELGRREEADRATTLASTALAALAGAGSPWSLHRAQMVVAGAAVREGWGDPRAWLRQAEAWFAEHDHPQLAARCRQVMREGGLAAPRRGRGAAEVPADLRARGVTSREMDVLELVAYRLTNREIAERLHISARTVEKHVASLLTKIGSSSRLELGRVATAEPAPTPP